MRKIILAITLIHFCLQGSSQSITPMVINAGGGFYNNPSSYSRYFDWSIAELALINTVAAPDSTVIVYQGVLQLGAEKPGYTPFSANFNSEDVKLFPNPTIGKFEINFFVNAQGILDLELTDAMGRIIERRSMNYGGCCRIVHYDISNLPAGVYFIIATIRPDPFNSYNVGQQPRRSGLRVVKMNP